MVVEQEACFVARWAERGRVMKTAGSAAEVWVSGLELRFVRVGLNERQGWRRDCSDTWSCLCLVSELDLCTCLNPRCISIIPPTRPFQQLYPSETPSNHPHHSTSLPHLQNPRKRKISPFVVQYPQ